MDPMTMGMLAGLGKSALIDGPKAERDRKLAATTASLSPWTGMSPTMPQEANAFGSAMQGGMAGAQFGQANPGMFKAPEANMASNEFSPAQMAGREAESSYQFPNQAMAQNSSKPKTFMSSWNSMPQSQLA